MFGAVFFDLDETLIPDEPLSKHAFFITALELTGDAATAHRLAEAAEREARAVSATLPRDAIEYCARIGHSALEGLWATYDRRIPEEAQLDEVIQFVREEAWRRALTATGEKGDASALEKRWRAVRARAPLFDDTDEVLALLRPRVKLGIITNGVAGLQSRKVELSGLAHWFDVVAISGSLGIGKPDPRIFEWAAQQVGVPLSQCAMVGDNSERDVQGGKNAGCATAWLDRGFRPAVVKADVQAKSLRELLPWLLN
jgi:putative hydrolase of the HAD superfamily